jgi:hypothetical protein
MDTQWLVGRSGQRIAKIEIDSRTGVQTLFVNGPWAGEYDPRTNHTIAYGGRIIGDGNLLAMLLNEKGNQ